MDIKSFLESALEKAEELGDPAKRAALEKDAEIAFKIAAAVMPAGAVKAALTAAAATFDSIVAMDPASKAS